MVNFSFADRYAEASLSPTADILEKRRKAVERIVSEIVQEQLLDLVEAYYGYMENDLSWFRDKLAEEDESFSIVNNERECRVLSAIIIGQLVEQGNAKAILAVVAGNLAGKRTPKDGLWLVPHASDALNRLAVSERQPPQIDAKVSSTFQQKLPDEINSIVQGDWPAFLEGMLKIRNESQTSMRTMASQTSNVVRAMYSQIRFQREESQMLWWIFSGHSRALARSFASFTSSQAAMVAAVDLATLTTVSEIGPVAAPAMLERVINLAKRPKGRAWCRLDETIDSLAREDLQRLEIVPETVPERIAPLTEAIELARTIGLGAWHTRFAESTGVQASIELQPLELAQQLYFEHLLGQLL